MTADTSDIISSESRLVERVEVAECANGSQELRHQIRVAATGTEQ